MGLGRTVVAASSVVVVAGLLLVQLDVAERLASSRELQLSRVAGLVESLASQQWEALAVGREDQQALADFFLRITLAVAALTFELFKQFHLDRQCFLDAPQMAQHFGPRPPGNAHLHGLS